MSEKENKKKDYSFDTFQLEEYKNISNAHFETNKKVELYKKAYEAAQNGFQVYMDDPSDTGSASLSDQEVELLAESIYHYGTALSKYSETKDLGRTPPPTVLKNWRKIRNDYQSKTR